MPRFNTQDNLFT